MARGRLFPAPSGGYDTFRFFAYRTVNRLERVVGKPLVLIIRDGWGIGDPLDPGNAVALAATPWVDSYLAQRPHTRLGCSGEQVGLVAGSQGSSEVGHLSMGAGRVVEQEVTRVNKLISTGKFFSEPLLVRAMENCRDSAALHLMGLLQDQGVHAMDRHLFALLEMAASFDLKKVRVHVFTDGRDTPPRSALGYLSKLDEEIRRHGVGRVASVMGRYYAMDRDNNWERVERAYRALLFGEGLRSPSAEEAVEAAYRRADAKKASGPAGEDRGALAESDEFIQPTLIAPEGREPLLIHPGDSVIFYNYRQDRAIELTRAFVDEDFSGFPRRKKPDLLFVGLTRYYDDFKNHVLPPMNMDQLFGQMISEGGLRQLRISETQKFAHVTSFFNGKRQEPFPGEERFLVDSPKVPENEKPEMSAPKLAEYCVLAVTRGIGALRQAARDDGEAHSCPQAGQKEDAEYLADTFDFIVINFVNGDMVGHTGDLGAAIKGIEAVDTAVGRVVEAVLARGGTALITADHGNSEQMIDPETGKPLTSHTLNPVEFIVVSEELKDVRLREGGGLADVAPTMLRILGIKQPPEMTGVSLIL